MNSNLPEKLPMPAHFARVLQAAGYESPTQRQAYVGAVGGKFPAEKINGVWHFNPDDVPLIAQALRLRPITQSVKAA